MPKGYPTTECKGCERPVSECGPLSLSYLCRDCGEHRSLANIHDLVNHSGEYFDHWRHRSLAALGVFAHDGEQT